MPDVGQGCSRTMHASERASPAGRRRAALARTTLAMTLAVAVTAACTTMPERNGAQPSGQQTCNVAGKFCDTFFGP